jgi:hypothetical protein
LRIADCGLRIEKQLAFHPRSARNQKSFQTCGTDCETRRLIANPHSAIRIPH